MVRTEMINFTLRHQEIELGPVDSHCDICIESFKSFFLKRSKKYQIERVKWDGGSVKEQYSVHREFDLRRDRLGLC